MGCALSFSGCQQPTTNNRINVNTVDFHTLDNDSLCCIYEYHANRSLEAEKYLIKRQVFTNNDWEFIGKKELKIGMLQCAIYAACTCSTNKVGSTTHNGTIISHSYTYFNIRLNNKIYKEVKFVVKNNRISEIFTQK